MGYGPLECLPQLMAGKSRSGKSTPQVLPGFGLGREREAGIAQERVGDELRGRLPALGIPFAPAVWCFKAHAITTRAMAVSIRCASVSATQSGE